MFRRWFGRAGDRTNERTLGEILGGWIGGAIGGATGVSIGGAVGPRGERNAERFLRRRGLCTVARNWRCRHGEIDLVMLDGEQLVFVEVRVRSRSGFGGAADSIGAGKQQRLARAAAMFLAAHPEHAERACRFDVAALGGADAQVEWIAGAFEGGR